MTTVTRGAPRASRQATTIYFAGYLLSVVGMGAWGPFQGIFLHEHRHLLAHQVGWYFAAVGVGAIVANLHASSLASRRGPFAVFVIAGLLQFPGPSLAVLGTSPLVIVIGGCLSGIGNGAFFAVQTGILVRLFSADGLSRILGRQYQLKNLGISASAPLCGVISHGFGFPGLLILALANAASSLLHALNVVVIVRRKSGIPQNSDIPAGPAPSSRGKVFSPFIDRSFMPLILLQLGLVIVGISQMVTMFLRPSPTLATDMIR